MPARLNGLDDAFDEALSEARAHITEAVSDSGAGLQSDWREQVLAAGLGQKMANTIRLRVYPQRGNSLDPAVIVWTKAPGAMEAFDQNPVILPVRGRFLAIPTENVPRFGRYNRRMTPAQVEKSFGQKLTVFRARKSRNLLGFIKRVAAPTKKGFTTSKTALRRAGREAELVLMFIFVRRVQVGKRIDLDSAAIYWADQAATRANLAFGG